MVRILNYIYLVDSIYFAATSTRKKPVSIRIVNFVLSIYDIIELPEKNEGLYR